MTAPKVSVCVVTYNHKDYIAQCLQSIVDQEIDFAFEIIVCDDCSTDGTSDIVREFAARHPQLIAAHIHKINIGPYENYKFAHLQAIGEYVAHIDGDDWMEPRKILCQTKQLDNMKHCQMSAHQMYLHSKRSLPKTTRTNPEEITVKYLLKTHPAFLNSSIMYRRNVVGAVFREKTHFIDFYVYVYAAINGPIAFANEPLGNYRENIGISSKNNYLPAIQAAISLAEPHISDVKIINRARAKQYFSYALLSLRQGRVGEFKNLLSQSRSLEPDWIRSQLIGAIGIAPSISRLALSLYRLIRS